MKLIFVQTGGTIDKDYPRVTNGWAFEFGEPATTRILSKLNPSFQYDVCTFCQKDSLEITNQDRMNLTKFILDHKDDKFVITHGTDSMIETAQFLSGHINDKLVVLTGAIRPERFTNSDADINVGAALATMSLVDKGIYIAMNGVVKSSTEIRRNLETGQFY